MAKNLWLSKFDPENEFVARRSFVAGDGRLNPGDPVDKTLFTVRRLRQMYDGRSIVNADVWAEFISGEDPVKSYVPRKATLTMPVNDELQFATEHPNIVLPDPHIIELEDNVPVVSLPGVDIERDKLLKDAAELGIEVDGRWGNKRLNEEIEKALNSNGESA